MRRLKQIISILLIVLLVLQNMQLDVYAYHAYTDSTGSTVVNQEDTPVEQSEETTTKDQEEKVVPIVTEVEAKPVQEDTAVAIDESWYFSNLNDVDSSWNNANNITINTSEQMIKLSNLDPSIYKNATISIAARADVLDLTNSVTLSDGTTLTYQGLGSAENPFSGTLKCSEAIPLKLNHALFNGLSSNANPDSATNYTEITWTGSSGNAILADYFVFESGVVTPQWNIPHIDNRNDTGAQTYFSYSGIIGTMKVATGITLTTGFLSLNVNWSTETISNVNKFSNQVENNNGSAGTYCNIMESGTNLTIVDGSIPSNSKITASYNAGGFVGWMNSNSKLTITNTNESTPISIAGATITGGTNAGGLVGYLSDATIIASNLSISNNNIIAGNSGSSAGGFVGCYETTTATTLDSSITIDGNTITSGTAGNAGGFVGSLCNKNDSGVAISIGGTTDNIFQVTNNILTAEYTDGGLIGVYDANKLASSLKIHDITVSSTQISGYNYGGVIGAVATDFFNGGDNSYVLVENINVSINSSVTNNLGGIIGQLGMGNGYASGQSMLELKNNVEISFVGVNASDSRGGVVGQIWNKSVLHLDGTTSFSGNDLTYGSGTGQIVGKQAKSLVYAEPTWVLSRASSRGRISDIGNYGEVIRLNDKIQNIITNDSNTHIVYVAPIVNTYGNTSTTVQINVGSAADFAALAITIQTENGFPIKTGNELNSNSFTYNQFQTSGILAGTINLTADINMSGTGIYSLTRDVDAPSNGGIPLPIQSFNGTMNGGEHTLTLQTGEVYGKDLTAASTNASSGQIYRHDYIGLFSKLIDGATIQNLNITGNMNFGADSNVKVGALAALSTGTVNIEYVTVETTFNFDKDQVCNVGGMIGEAEGVDISDSTSKANIIYTGGNDNPIIGGVLGYKHKGSGVEFSNVTLSGNIESNSSGNAKVGGLIAVVEAYDNSNTTTISLESITVDGQKITTSASTTSGGLLGYQWNSVEVTFHNVDIKGSSALKLNGNAVAGGLVYSSTGHWIVEKDSKAGITISDFAFDFVKTDNSASPNALLVAVGNSQDKLALYLEVRAEGYSIINVTGNAKDATYFDELVGKSMTNSSGTSGQGIVSYNNGNSDGKIDSNNCDTYKNVVAINAKNNKTRYYYNLDTICSTGLDLSSGSIDSENRLMAWGLVHYAADNLKQYFASYQAASYTITNTLDMSNYSYYPVDGNGDTNISGATITFNNEEIETTEANNKKTSASDSQHYGMQCGLFNNVTADKLNVSNLTLSGSVGKYNGSSGALIAGYFSSGYGDLPAGGGKDSQTKLIREISLNNVTLKDLYIVNCDESSPLLINSIASNVTGRDSSEYGYCQITITGVKTAKGDNSSSYNMNSQAYAASSLIGTVGNTAANSIALSFSDIRLDARINPDTLIETYGTIKSLFSTATLLDSFRYASGSSGSYTFNYSDDYNSEDKHIYHVTYGKEITDSNKNPGNQLQYYDEDIDVYDGDVESFSSNYRPYVAKTQYDNPTDYDKYNEIDVNIKKGDLSKGCGTYSDPYQITDSKQINSLKNALNGTTPSNWIVNVNITETGCPGGDSNTHQTYIYDSSSKLWYEYNSETNYVNKSGISISNNDMITYLQGGYYSIEEDIEMSRGFTGIGTSTSSFHGVFIGKKDGDNVPTITIPAGKEAMSTFGGLINVSDGSVVKDLNFKFTSSKLTDSEEDSKNDFTIDVTAISGRYFGGVIGTIKNGDNIIDNVTIDYSDFNNGSNKITYSGSNQRNTPVGGYIGLIEQGGIIFRNMVSTLHENNIVSVGGKSSNDGGSDISDTYYYLNPYIGCIWDGFAINETTDTNIITLNNTNKNCQIINIDPNKDKNSFAFSSNTLTIHNAKGLYLVGSLVSSGALSDGTVKYTMKRSAKYDGSDTDNAKSDYYAYFDNGSINGLKDSNSNAQSYIWQFGNISSTSNVSSVKNIVTINFFENETYNMTAYKNGFRGISARTRMDSTRNSFYKVQNINGNNATIIYEMIVREYSNDTSDAKTTGVGLFPRMFTRDNTCTISNINIEETTVMLKQVDSSTGLALDNSYSDNANGATDIGVGALIGVNATQNNKIYTINNCKLNNVNVSGSNYAGGFIGITRYSETFENSYYTNLQVTAVNSVGGFVGVINAGGINLKNTNTNVLSNTGGTLKTVKRTDNNGIGGVVGKILSGTSQLNGENGEIQFSNIVMDSSQNVAAGGLIGYITKAAGNITINNVHLDQNEGNNSRINLSNNTCYIGGFIGYIGENINESKISNSSIGQGGTTSINVGDTFRGNVGGLVGEAKSTLTIENCTVGKEFEDDTKNVTISARNNTNTDQTMNRAGGLVGNLTNSSTLTVSNCIVRGTIIQGYARTGGIVSELTSGSTLKLNNVLINNNEITSSQRSGGILGSANGGLYGSNIALVDTNIKVDPNISSTDTGKGVGVWVGYSSDASQTIQLAGVSRQITTSSSLTLPEKEVGGTNDDVATKAYTGYIVYSDYTGAAISDGANTNGTSPYVTVNPDSGLSVWDGDIETRLTGDGTARNNSNSIVKKILDESTNTLIKTPYKNSGVNAITSIDGYSSTCTWLSSYNTAQELQSGSISYLEDDISVFLLDTNDASNVTARINAYLDLLTNGGYLAAKTLGTAVSSSVKTYKFNSNNNRFEAVTDTSLKVYNNGTSNISYAVNPGKYDNELNQFTLLSITFGDDNTGRYTLQVPIVVKQVVTISSSAIVANDSPFYESVYDDRATSHNHILLEYGQSLTAQITYSYSKYDWVTSANNGASLLWDYNRKITFGGNGSMPVGTTLTLISKEKPEQQLYYTISESSGTNTQVTLNDFTVTPGDNTANKGDLLKLNDILELKAEINENGRLVVCGDGETATVTAMSNEQVLNLRLATDTELANANINKYIVRSGTTLDENNTISENYYLVINLPKSTEVENPITINASIKLSIDNGDTPVSGHLPFVFSQSQDETNCNENVFVVNKSFNQVITSTSTANNFQKVTVGNPINTTITDTISIDKRFAEYIYPANDSIYHQLHFTLKDKPSNESINIPAGTQCKVTFNVANSNLESKTVEYTTNTLVSSLDITYDQNLASLIKEQQNNSNVELVITANIELKFSTPESIEIFPSYEEQHSHDANESHIYVDTEARMGFSKTVFSSATKALKQGTTGYYVEKNMNPTLSYTGDYVSQLGINPKDPALIGDVSIINTTGNFDLSSLSEEEINAMINNSKKIVCTLTFAQKDGNGKYQDIEPNNYLEGIYAGAGNSASKLIHQANTSTYFWTIEKGTDLYGGKYNSDISQFVLPFELRVKNSIENVDGFYANYRVTLTVQLFDSNGSIIAGNGLSDYVIYTFAKIPTTIVK